MIWTTITDIRNINVFEISKSAESKWGSHAEEKVKNPFDKHYNLASDRPFITKKDRKELN